MREIIFRGKRVDTGEWTYGYYSVFEDNPYIGRGGAKRMVTSESIGQYTSFKDKNLKTIFEGDIIKQGKIIVQVRFRYGCFFLCSPGDNGQIMNKGATDFHHLAERYQQMGERPFCKLEIIGNIYEHENLIKDAKGD